LPLVADGFLYNLRLHAIKTILAKYTAWVWAILQPLGSWGVFCIAFIDSAAWGMPLDPVVAGYCYAQPKKAPFYILMAAAGSALGSVIIYFIGEKGGELVLEKRVGKARMERMRDKFEQHEFLTLMLPSMLPPPTPFKAILLAAAVFQMRLRDFLLAIFIGRLLRFSLLAALTLIFGPQIVSFFGTVVIRHWAISLGLFVAACAGIWLWFRSQSRRKKT
jgi:membrane protein YqaA with SNARE-associated domain